jgi:hypothetical protein
VRNEFIDSVLTTARLANAPYVCVTAYVTLRLEAVEVGVSFQGLL